MDERRIDLSALDPGRDPERYERMVQSVLARTAHPPAHPFAAELVSRGRIAIVAAAAAAILAWVPALTGRPEVAATGTSAAVASGDAATTLATWASAGEIPAGTDVYGVLGVNDER